MAPKTRTAVGVIALAISGPAFAQASHTHWEPYKNAGTPPSVDQRLTDPVLLGAIDLHAHHGPDSYPRQWDAFEVASLAQERGLRAIVLKNHWTETASTASSFASTGRRASRFSAPSRSTRLWAA
jgi:hypothetical protein